MFKFLDNVLGVFLATFFVCAMSLMLLGTAAIFVLAVMAVT